MFGQLLMLSTENSLDFQKVMEYPLGPVPWALATPDGFLIKTNKAVMMHKLEDTSALQSPAQDQENIHIIDGNALYSRSTYVWSTRYLQQGNDGVLSVEWCKDLISKQLADILSGSDTEQEEDTDKNNLQYMYYDASAEEDKISDSESDNIEDELMA